MGSNPWVDPSILPPVRLEKKKNKIALPVMMCTSVDSGAVVSAATVNDPWCGHHVEPEHDRSSLPERVLPHGCRVRGRGAPAHRFLQNYLIREIDLICE